jgi:hypothetical protein
MGGGSWSDDEWKGYAAARSYGTKTVDGIYTSKHIDPLLDPKGVNIRESRDSKDNPNSNAIIIGLDVTGSMHRVLDSIAKKGLNILMTEIYNRKPVADPHVMFCGVGDVVCDDAPLQCTQFEADIRIADQMAKIYFEKGGGGNDCESYTFPWYFAANHTSIDCFEKRGKKGYLFTIGDEPPPKVLKSAEIEEFLGEKVQKDYTSEELLAMVSRQYEVFHIIIEEGNCGKDPSTINGWMGLLGQRAIKLADHTKLAEVIVSTIQINEGAHTDDVVKSWDGTTSIVVQKAVAGLAAMQNTASAVVRF